MFWPTVPIILAIQVVTQPLCHSYCCDYLRAAFVVASVPSDASKCTLSNIEVLNQFIDERINATVAAIVAEVTATLEESIAASVNAMFDVLNATVDDRIATVNTTVSALNATVDERITTVSITVTVGAHGVSIAKLLSQLGKFVVEQCRYVVYIIIIYGSSLISRPTSSFSILCTEIH